MKLLQLIRQTMGSRLFWSVMSPLWRPRSIPAGWEPDPGIIAMGIRPRQVARIYLEYRTAHRRWSLQIGQWYKPTFRIRNTAPNKEAASAK